MDIEQNKQEYIKIWNELIAPEYVGADKLLEWICGTDFFEAPASTKYHLAVKGGLCQHSLNVFKRMYKLVEDANKLNEITPPMIALSTLCHDLCKCDSYIIDFKNVKKYYNEGTKQDGRGRYDWMSEECYTYEPKFCFGHGGKSLYIVQNFILALPLDEAMAIRYHMGGMEYPGTNMFEPEMSRIFAEYPIVLYIHFADMQATYFDEGNPNND